jgi:hypothetical protein
VPGFEFRLSDGNGTLVLGNAPGSAEAKDVGDVRIELAKE